MTYLKVSSTWVKENQGYQKGSSQVFARQLTNGDWVTDLNTLRDFPELFGKEIAIVKDITVNHFQIQEDQQ